MVKLFSWDWGIQVVLSTFEAQPLSDEEGNANNLEEEAAAFSIKYLTSSKLMGLEVSNAEWCYDYFPSILYIYIFGFF